MSDGAMTPEQVDAILRPYQQRLAELKARRNRVGHWVPNKRYVIDIEVSSDEIPLVGDQGNQASTFAENSDFLDVEGQTNIDGGVIFRCLEIEIIYSITGTSAATGLPASYVVSAPQRGQIIDFYTKLRDSGSDREWMNDWVPGDFFASANLSGLILGDESQIVVSGGSTVTASIQAAWMNDDVSGLQTVLKHSWRISLIGCQTPLENA